MDSKLMLEPSVGFWGTVSLVIGDIIGSGIFVSPTGIASSMGSVGGSLVIWLMCGLVALLASHIWAELGVYMKDSGGDYAYQKRALGTPFAFIFVWVQVSALRPAGVATLCLISSEYILALFYNDGCGDAPRLSRVLLAIFVMFLMTWINATSVSLSRNLQIICMFGKIGVLCVIIVGGFVNIGKGMTQNFENAFEGTTTNPGDIAVAFYNGLWAYNGWSSICLVTEEIKNPERNLPLAIWMAEPTIILIYLLTNVSYFTVMTVPQMLASPTVVVTWAQVVMPHFIWFFSLGVAVSTYGSANGNVFTTARLTYAAARDGNWIGFLAYITPKYKTPLPSIGYLLVFAIVFAIPANVGTLINFLGFTNWIFYFLTTLSLIIMRFRFPDEPRPYKLPLVIPFIVLVFAGYLVLSPIIFTTDRLPYVWSMCFLLAGMILYVPFVFYAWRLPGIDHVTTAVQLLLCVAPEDEYEFDESNVVIKGKNLQSGAPRNEFTKF